VHDTWNEGIQRGFVVGWYFSTSGTNHDCALIDRSSMTFDLTRAVHAIHGCTRQAHTVVLLDPRPRAKATIQFSFKLGARFFITRS
jgi:hypothetical protein